MGRPLWVQEHRDFHCFQIHLQKCGGCDLHLLRSFVPACPVEPLCRRGRELAQAVRKWAYVEDGVVYSKLDAFQKTVPVQIEILPQHQIARALLYALLRGYSPSQAHRRQTTRTSYTQITAETRIHQVIREVPCRLASKRRLTLW